jgi:hypothetical protein
MSLCGRAHGAISWREQIDSILHCNQSDLFKRGGNGHASLQVMGPDILALAADTRLRYSPRPVAPLARYMTNVNGKESFQQITTVRKMEWPGGAVRGFTASAKSSPMPDTRGDFGSSGLAQRIGRGP